MHRMSVALALASIVAGCAGETPRATVSPASSSVRPGLASERPTARAPHRRLAWAITQPGEEHDPKSGLPMEVIDRATRIELVLIPAGDFYMGVSPGDEAFDPKENWADERRARLVSILKPFYLGKYEVAQYQCDLGLRDGHHFEEESLRNPVIGVSWNDVQSWLGGNGLRLPTDAEWEYACRAGTTGPTYGPLDEIAWYRCRFQPVGQRKPNAFGLYDMLGNAWEWCSDATYSLKTSTPDKPEYYRVLRGGGACNQSTYWLRASVRPSQKPTYSNTVGFRVARDP